MVLFELIRVVGGFIGDEVECCSGGGGLRCRSCGIHMLRDFSLLKTRRLLFLSFT